MDKDSLANLATSAEIDQAVAGMKTIAAVSMAFYRDAISEGFTKLQAFEMVLQWQHVMFQASRKAKPEGNES